MAGKQSPAADRVRAVVREAVSSIMTIRARPVDVNAIANRAALRLGDLTELGDACDRMLSECNHDGCVDNNHVEGCPGLTAWQDVKALRNKANPL